MNAPPRETSALIDRLQIGVVVHAPDTAVVYANRRALELLRITEDQVLGKAAYDPQWTFLDRHGRPLAPQAYPVNRVQRSGESLENVEIGISDGDGRSITWILCSAYPEFVDGQSDQVESIVVTFYDITRRRQAIPFEDIVERASDAVMVTEAYPIDGHGPKIVYVNAAVTALTGYSEGELLGRTPRMLQGPDTDRAQLDRIRAALVEERAVRSQLLNYTREGAAYWVEINLVPLRSDTGEVLYYAAIERDITEAKERELDLEELSIRDPLTGLHNRRGFTELADPAVALAQRGDVATTVAVLDIDYFKVINDTHGHGIGDQALKMLAEIVQGQLRSSDIVGRMGGEEFAMLLANTDLDGAVAKMESLRQEIERRSMPLCDGQELRMTVSIGVAPLEVSERDASAREAIDAALATADAALYRAKLSGRNRVLAAAANKRES